VRIYLDDVRKTPYGWVRCYNTHELIKLFREHESEVEIISLDHDLGEGLDEGIYFLNWLEEQLYMGSVQHLPEIRIHSDNPVGRKNLEAALDSCKRIFDKTVQ
jgi:hypothetical protein